MSIVRTTRRWYRFTLRVILTRVFGIATLTLITLTTSSKCTHTDPTTVIYQHSSVIPTTLPASLEPVSGAATATQFADILQFDNTFNLWVSSFHSPIYQSEPNEPLTCIVRLVNMVEACERLGGSGFKPVHINTKVGPISLRPRYVTEYVSTQVGRILAGESADAVERSTKYGIIYGWDPNINIAVYVHELGHLTPTGHSGIYLLYSAHKVCSELRWRMLDVAPTEDKIIYWTTKIRRSLGGSPLVGITTGLGVSVALSTPQLIEEARASFRGYTALVETGEGINCPIISEAELSTAWKDLFGLWTTYLTPVVRGIEVGLGSS